MYNKLLKRYFFKAFLPTDENKKRETYRIIEEDLTYISQMINLEFNEVFKLIRLFFTNELGITIYVLPIDDKLLNLLNEIELKASIENLDGLISALESEGNFGYHQQIFNMKIRLINELNNL